jgi:hypothetical protein
VHLEQGYEKLVKTPPVGISASEWKLMVESYTYCDSVSGFSIPACAAGSAKKPKIKMLVGSVHCIILDWGGLGCGHKWLMLLGENSVRCVGTNECIT